MKKYHHILGVVLLILLIMATFAIYAADAQDTDHSPNSVSDDPYPHPGVTPVPYPSKDEYLPAIFTSVKLK
jgi:hypothetical protein